MKLPVVCVGVQHFLSLPVRGAWIEMFRALSYATKTASLPVRGAWIEICVIWAWSTRRKAVSLPVRGAWIEINDMWRNAVHDKVAPRAGSVD